MLVFNWTSNGPTGPAYSPTEYDNGSQTGPVTIDWNNGPVQYITLTGNVTFAFSNPVAGGRYTLEIAGAFTPTFPANVRWPAGTTPTPGVTAGKKDIYSFLYSAKDGLYDGVMNPLYATT